MARIDKEEQARRDGMAYALRIAKEKGIDALEEDLKMRNATNIPVGLTKKVIDEWCNGMKAQTIDSIGILAMVTLRDGFGFGTKRLNKFRDIFNNKTECLMNPDWTTWEDQLEILKEECGIDAFIHVNKGIRV